MPWSTPTGVIPCRQRSTWMSSDSKIGEERNDGLSGPDIGIIPYNNSFIIERIPWVGIVSNQVEMCPSEGTI